MAYSQAFEPGTLSFRSMTGNEALSTLFDFEVQLVSSDASLDLKSALGKSLTLEIQPQVGALRYLDGQITRFEFNGRETLTSRSYIYTATVRPSLWYLTRSINGRIFQEKTVVEIIQEVFSAYGFPVTNRLSATYRTWGYCTQFQETDFAFVSRLMEQEGIYYYFTHQMGQHTLVLVDDMSGHDPLPDYASLPYLAPDQIALPETEGVDRWHTEDNVTTGRYVVDDYDFRKPKADLQSQQANPLSDDHGSYEKYNWQLGYVNGDEGSHYSRVRLEEEQTGSESAHGHTTIRAFAPGYLFTLTGCPRTADNREYLIVGASYHFQNGGDASGSSTAAYDTEFVSQPTSLPWRAPSVTPLPKAPGPQTAVVTGPAGETIWTDQNGRVKLQFRWDRYGKSDENSSCWVRVSDAWAGSNYGGIYIPRIGQEVVVDFMNGDIDRPLITGRVYNASQMPPFNLPDSATQSGFLTRTPNGNSSNANMFRFEDKQGSEQVKLHAERNYDTSVEANTTHATAGSHTIEVGLPLASGDTSTSPPPSGAQRLLNQQPSTSTSASASTAGQLQQAMAAQAGKRGKKARARSGMQQSTPSTSSSSTSQPSTSSNTLASQVPAFIQNFLQPDLSGSVYAVTVNGFKNTLVVGESTSLTFGVANNVISGIENRLSIGNKLDIIAGTREQFHAVNVSIRGVEVAARASSFETKGAEFKATGSSISTLGSSISSTGSSMRTVGYDVKF
ncbi:type VI secretion system tip protein TssI/VgrG [Caballeronia sp. LZ034LL]|uniref:type VI secretion system Vgr family protein n=1 Tax=Caballeronia sp. LZ034LL TaxID=3038567 RepID=UPI002855D64A|nr:type VI secretion system tip protein TssI/VgrG [Caballeronia sp. LZ034LL]MDR5836402.1 type VI secretion system tip protein TssI/VgrG [Caballeronia sp. LZ034LL]